MSIRVLVAGDQSMVRAGFRMLLSGEKDIEVVAEASNGLEAVDKAARFDPTVVLMDIRHARARRAGGDRRILAAENTTRILMLTTFDLDEYIYEALKAGASDFVLKDDPPEQLIAAVRTVAAGKRCSPTITKRVIEHFTRIHARRRRKDRRAHCPRARVFLSIAAGHSNAEIAQELYISETTVKTHVTHIFQKLNLRDRAQAVVLAHQAGLLEADAPRADWRRAGKPGGYNWPAGRSFDGLERVRRDLQAAVAYHTPKARLAPPTPARSRRTRAWDVRRAASRALSTERSSRAP